MIDSVQQHAKPPPPSMVAHMSGPETDLLSKYLEGVEFLLEFGCGGSTVLAARLGVKKIISVDSDRAWLSRVKAASELQGVEFASVFADVGPIREWGTPTETSHARKWPNYYLSVWEKIEKYPDIVLVDGRFRIACVLQSLLRCGPETRIAIHDFWNRDHYHVVLQFLQCIEREGTLGIFEPSPTLDWKKLSLAVSKHIFDYL